MMPFEPCGKTFSLYCSNSRNEQGEATILYKFNLLNIRVLGEGLGVEAMNWRRILLVVK